MFIWTFMFRDLVSAPLEKNPDPSHSVRFSKAVLSHHQASILELSIFFATRPQRNAIKNWASEAIKADQPSWALSGLQVSCGVGGHWLILGIAEYWKTTLRFLSFWNETVQIHWVFLILQGLGGAGWLRTCSFGVERRPESIEKHCVFNIFPNDLYNLSVTSKTANYNVFANVWKLEKYGV